MRFLGILRASALCLLVSAFHGTNCQDLDEKQMQEKLMQEIAEQRKELVERLSKSDAPYSLQDMTFFLGILRDEADVDPEAVLKIGEKIHTFLGNFGIHGEDAKASLAIFMEMIQEYVMGLFSSTKQLSNEERAEMRKTVAAILEQLPKSYVDTQAEDSTIDLPSE
ncbi:hypothetical protein X943_002816 [Babesia divergens]|uniref:Bd37 core domain-containing protein n=1 Tax=Babesia divergens TaxID=32595 RepID=A0AAD9G7G5_BABDI|nr:hypothetical protein X943_002816 [Babesia divergens]